MLLSGGAFKQKTANLVFISYLKTSKNIKYVITPLIMIIKVIFATADWTHHYEALKKQWFKNQMENEESILDCHLL